MLSWWPTGLRARMAIGFSILLWMVATSAAAYFVAQTSAFQLAAQRQQGTSLITLATPALRQTIANHDSHALNAVLRHLLQDPAVCALQLIDADGRSVVALERDDEQASWWTQALIRDLDAQRRVTGDIDTEDGRAQQLALILAVAPLNATVHHLLADSAIFVALLVALFMVLSYSLLVRYTAPLKPLTEIARQVSRGNWTPDVTLIPSKSREIHELNQAFSDGAAAMRHYIQNLEETRERLLHSENRLRNLINSMHEILFELDADGRLSFLNPAWRILTGHSVEDSLGRPLREFLIEREAIEDFAPERLSVLSVKNREIALRSASGQQLWVNLDAEAQFDKAGRCVGVVGTLSDITQSVELNRLLTKYQDDLYYLSVTDPLTGLYNRRHFDTQLEVMLTEHLSKQQPVCLLIIDLDGFKFINDTYGHPHGDKALRSIADLLRRHVRTKDYLARLAGDEFGMVLLNTGLGDATQIANKIHAAINQTRIELPVGHIQLQASIGVAAAPFHGRNPQELMSAADVALYQGKRQGRNRVQVLSRDINRALMTIFSQGFQLRHALEQGDLLPAFQPICDIETGETIAFEALARMRHDGATILAEDFISVAEELGLTRDIDLHIIAQAIRLAPAGYGLFLNLDPSSFNDRQFVKQLGELVAPACRAGRTIVIELTEREHVDFNAALAADVKGLRELGCQFALDDFGSGYSTYQFLNLFQPEYLKIEGSFVRGMLHNEANRKIVSHIHELAAAFGIQTIAESVEDEATRLALKQLGIRCAQGWHLGRPRWFES